MKKNKTLSRVYRPLVIGLTGSVGMGKSTAAKTLHDFGLPVYNADQVVHDLLKRGGKAVVPVARLFPTTVRRGAIDRRQLGALVFNDPVKLRRLENILHPLVLRAELEFLAKAHENGAAAVVLEIPLLFETGSEKRCDVVLCVTAPRAVQQARVLRRPGMTAEKFCAILKQQMPDKEKRQRADYVIKTGRDHADTKRHLAHLWETLQRKEIEK